MEDHHELGLALAQGLRGAGFRIQLAGSCKEGKRFIETKSFDLLLTDLRLSGCSGVNLCEMAQKHDLPAIIITGEASREELAQAVNAGASMVLLKPFDFEALIQLIEHQIRKHQPDEMVKRAYRKLLQSG